jgi:AcrR family transcriptional regulator
MTPKQQRGADRRAAILDAADRLFRSQGYAATSMRQNRRGSRIRAGRQRPL